MIPGRILVVVPSRDRQEEVKHLFKSFKRYSVGIADMVVGTDPQSDPYPATIPYTMVAHENYGDGVLAILEKLPEYEYVMFGTDEMQFGKGWALSAKLLFEIIPSNGVVCGEGDRAPIVRGALLADLEIAGLDRDACWETVIGDRPLFYIPGIHELQS